VERLRTLRVEGLALAAPQRLPPSLRYLRVSTPSFVPLHAQHLADAIGQLPLLEHLDLRQQQLWRPQGAQGAEHSHPRWGSWLQLAHLHTVRLEWINSWARPPSDYELLVPNPRSYRTLLSDEQVDVLRKLPSLTRLDVSSAGLAERTDFLGHLCREPPALQLRELSCGKLDADDLYSLAAAVPTLTALHFHDERLSDEQLAQLLSPLQQLQELRLVNVAAGSAAFLQSGSLPRTLRSLCLQSAIPAAELEQHLPALRSLTALVLLPCSGGGGGAAALEPLTQRLRVPSALLPWLQSFSSEWAGLDGPRRASPFEWN